MYSGGLTCFCCGDPSGPYLPSEIQDGNCLLVEWQEQRWGQEVTIQKRFCGDDAGRRDSEMHLRAREFVREHPNLSFTHWMWKWEVQERQEEEPWYVRAYDQTLLRVLEFLVQ